MSSRHWLIFNFEEIGGTDTNLQVSFNIFSDVLTRMHSFMVRTLDQIRFSGGAKIQNMCFEGRLQFVQDLQRIISIRKRQEPFLGIEVRC
jgi:UDP-N-acetylglucosamine enolpyruvyl transferase